jgi:hypothetical protein
MERLRQDGKRATIFAIEIDKGTAEDGKAHTASHVTENPADEGIFWIQESYTPDTLQPVRKALGIEAGKPFLHAAFANPPWPQYPVSLKEENKPPVSISSILPYYARKAGPTGAGILRSFVDTLARHDLQRNGLYAGVCVSPAWNAARKPAHQPTGIVALDIVARSMGEVWWFRKLDEQKSGTEYMKWFLDAFAQHYPEAIANALAAWPFDEAVHLGFIAANNPEQRTKSPVAAQITYDETFRLSPVTWDMRKEIQQQEGAMLAERAQAYWLERQARGNQS